MVAAGVCLCVSREADGGGGGVKASRVVEVVMEGWMRGGSSDSPVPCGYRLPLQTSQDR